jgi:xanthine dehydrogenase YagS FAD-binding subunit
MFWKRCAPEESSMAISSFEWVDAATVEQAASFLAESTEQHQVLAKAGGIDLLDLMKEGILAPARLVNLKTVRGLDDVATEDGLSLGALVTLDRIDSDPQIRSHYVALSEAAGHAATPQVRNAATIGGNLLQRPRCWYFRHDHFHGDGADELARSGAVENQHHAIFDNQDTAMVQASTPATALVAYDASIELAGGANGSRVVKLADFFLPTKMQDARNTKIEPGEVLTRVIVPAPTAGTKAAYHKQTERESYDWPICDVAVVLSMEGETVQSAAIAMGWVAPTPRRATESEQLLAGNRVTDGLARQAARAAIAEATPLSKNGYKLPVLEAVVRRTILAAAA